MYKIVEQVVCESAVWSRIAQGTGSAQQITTEIIYWSLRCSDDDVIMGMTLKIWLMISHKILVFDLYNTTRYNIKCNITSIFTTFFRYNCSQTTSKLSKINILSIFFQNNFDIWKNIIKWPYYKNNKQKIFIIIAYLSSASNPSSFEPMTATRNHRSPRRTSSSYHYYFIYDRPNSHRCFILLLALH